MPRPKKQHLKRRKDGRFCCVYHGIQFMGNTEDEALEKREEYKRKEQLEEYILQDPTVSEYAERWLPVAKAGVRANSLRNNELGISHLCAVIGDKKVKDVKPLDIKKVYSQEFLGASAGYIAHARSLYKALFASAVEDGLIRSNPAASDTAKPHKAQSGSHRAITQEERDLICTIATDHRMHAAAMLMLYAGLRPQEVKALRVDNDVDFDAGVIHVRSFVHQAGHNHYTVDSIGKTEKATRAVPLFAPVREALQGKKGFLISDRNGDVASRSAWLSAWESYRYQMEMHLNGCTKQQYLASAKKQEMPPWKQFTVVPYDLRHSFATWCRDNGVELHTCVEWMGHADAQMILRIYDEVTSDRSQKEAERLENMLIQMQKHMQRNEEPSQTVAP